jgi:hypothetical protein
MDPSSEHSSTLPGLAEKEKGSSLQDGDALAVLQQIESRDTSHPIYWPAWKKWAIVTVYCLLQVFVTLTSTTYVGVEFLIQEKYGSTTQVITLGQSMFIVGNAVGPAFLGPLSYALNFAISLRKRDKLTIFSAATLEAVNGYTSAQFSSTRF